MCLEQAELITNMILTFVCENQLPITTLIKLIMKQMKQELQLPETSTNDDFSEYMFTRVICFVHVFDGIQVLNIYFGTTEIYVGFQEGWILGYIDLVWNRIKDYFNSTFV